MQLEMLQRIYGSCVEIGCFLCVKWVGSTCFALVCVRTILKQAGLTCSLPIPHGASVKCVEECGEWHVGCNAMQWGLEGLPYGAVTQQNGSHFYFMFLLMAHLRKLSTTLATVRLMVGRLANTELEHFAKTIRIRPANPSQHCNGHNYSNISLRFAYETS
jgi:hypothetical protein